MGSWQNVIVKQVPEFANFGEGSPEDQVVIIWHQKYVQEMKQNAPTYDAFAEWLVSRGYLHQFIRHYQQLVNPPEIEDTSVQQYGRLISPNTERVSVGAVQGQSDTPRFGHRGRPYELANTSRAQQPPEDKMKKKVATSGDQVEFNLAAEIFETEWGQWVLLVFFLILTLVDLVTNVWMLTAQTDLGTAVEKANFWHWIIGGILVFSEMYVTMARSLIKRTSKNRGTQISYLYAMLVISIIAAVYDFAATVVPLYRFISANGDVTGMVGGIVVGLLIAIVTTVGSSKLIEQAKICSDLLRQRK